MPGTRLRQGFAGLSRASPPKLLAKAGKRGHDGEWGALDLRSHCEPTGRRKAPPDDRLREAIQRATAEPWIASSLKLLAMTVLIE